jgi:membrane-associated protease RseP (regulator of RpoE activity)
LLSILLFILTFFSTSQFGAALSRSFARGHVLDEDSLSWSYRLLVELLVPGRSTRGVGLITGLSYSIPLLSILLAHELGHYWQCRKWRVQASLPYFGPSPTLLGTIGAFIWIRSPIYNRKTLFDIGVSGPICGFIVLIPVLIAGVWQSTLSNHGTALLSFGTPLILRLAEAIRFPGVQPEHIVLHPMAVAAWAGLLATAINLLPIGQLDGAHIVYADLGPEYHKLISRGVLILLVLAGFFYWPWWLWSAGLFFFRRHPSIYDVEPVNAGRRWLCAVALVLLIVSFVPVPIRIS